MLLLVTVSLQSYPGHTAACLLDGGTSPSKSDRRFGARADGPAHSHHPLGKPNRQGRHASPSRARPLLLVLLCICACRRREGGLIWSPVRITLLQVALIELMCSFQYFSDFSILSEFMQHLKTDGQIIYFRLKFHH